MRGYGEGQDTVMPPRRNVTDVALGPATARRSFYSMDADPRGWQTHGSYWSVGTHSPLQSTIAPDSSAAGYAGWGFPGKRILNPYVPRPGGFHAQSLSQYSYPVKYPKYAGGYFPGGAGTPGAQSPLMLPALALVGMVVLAGVWQDRGTGRK